MKGIRTRKWSWIVRRRTVSCISIIQRREASNQWPRLVVRCLVEKDPLYSIEMATSRRSHLPPLGGLLTRKRLHFSTPFPDKNRNREQNTPKKYYQELPESQQDKLNYSPDYCD